MAEQIIDDFAETTTKRIFKNLTLSAFDRKEMSLTLLRIAITVLKEYDDENLLAFKGIRHAAMLARKGEYEDIAMVATGKFLRNLAEESPIENTTRLFYQKCIALISSEIQADERNEYFECIKQGLSLFQQKRLDACYHDIFS
jgi:hypothetical protein